MNKSRPRSSLVTTEVHDGVSAHFFRPFLNGHFFLQDKVSLSRVNDGDDVEEVLRGITGGGDGGMIGWEGAMALPESDSIDKTRPYHLSFSIFERKGSTVHHTASTFTSIKSGSE
mmetsp:Transcript_34123/g.67201  ORF Transcript_34123/g.67201 Transcript_34123/m.67201 type:complete len:115 (-) Transcript_34123:746-1090(-)